MNLNIEKYYLDVIKSYNEKSTISDIDFWLSECVPGTMDVSKLKLSCIIRNGLFVEIERILNLTNETNIAMIIHNLSQKFNKTPIELINHISKF